MRKIYLCIGVMIVCDTSRFLLGEGLPWVTFLNSIIKKLYNSYKYMCLCVLCLYGLQGTYPYPIKIVGFVSGFAIIAAGFTEIRSFHFHARSIILVYIY